MMDNDIVRNKRSRIADAIFIIMMTVLLGWQIVTSFFGIDFSDSSYYIANYKTFFNGLINSRSNAFLSNYFGALLYKLIPSHEYLAFQIIGALFFDVAVVSVWLLFRKKMPRLLLPATLFVGTLALTTLPTGVSYNSFSILLLVPAALLLVKGLETGKGWIKLAFSGFLIGFSFFFRIPNVIFAGLFIAVIWYDVFCAKNKKLFRDILPFFFGGVGGAAAGLLIVKLATRAGMVSDTAKNLIKSVSDQENRHSIFRIVSHLGRNVLDGLEDIAFGYLIGLAVIAVLALVILRFVKVKSKYVFIAAAIAAAGVTVFAQVTRYKPDLYITWFNTFGIFLYIFEAFFVFYYRKKDPALSLRSLVTLYFGVAICVGTDNGMCQNCLVTYLLLASVVCNVYNFAREDREKLSFTKKILPLLAVIMATVMFVGIAWIFGNRSSSKKYRDFNFCTLDSYTDAPAFGRVKTTKEKAAALNTVYWFFKDADYSDKRTLVFGDFPAFYLATDCRAYKSSVWMDSASEAYLKGKLNESLEAGDLPIFVFNKCHYGYIKEIPITWTESSATARNFAADHGYVQVFDNDYIEILVPQD